MYKVIIADDEPVIVLGLRKLIEWERFGLSIVGEAYDGKTLWKKITLLKPDIVVLDISMPEILGTDVIRLAREAELPTQFIFISGYQDFSYAKDAITYHAVDYLLKPIGRSELEHALRTAIQNMEKSSMDDLLNKADNLRPLFNSISKNDADSLYEYFKSQEINFENSTFVGAVFSFAPDSALSIRGTDKFDLIRFAVFNDIKKIIQSEKTGFSIRRDESGYYTIFYFPRNYSDEMINHFILSVTDRIFSRFHVKLFTGIGSRTNDISRLMYLYRSAKFCESLRFFLTQETIFLSQVAHSYSHSFDEEAIAFHDLLQAVTDGNSNWIDKCSADLRLIKSIHFGNKAAALNKVIANLDHLGNTMMQTIPSDDIAECRSNYQKLVDYASISETFDDLEKRAAECVSTLVREAQGSKPAANATIAKVKQYVEDNYGKPLSLQDIAEYAYMNPSYFSTFFKKTTGNTFSSYLLDVRMKAAVEIMAKEPDIYVKDLAIRCGYKDTKTFIEKFRETYGTTPAQYKKEGSFL